MRVFRPSLFLLFTIARDGNALVLGGPRALPSVDGDGPKQLGNGVSANCTPPASFMQLFQTKNPTNPTPVMVSSSYALYGADDGYEINLFAYDCTNDRELIFVHIPKNAGTSIELLAAGSGIQWGMNALPGVQSMPDGDQCSRWHVPPAMLQGSNPYANSNAEVFCVTRNPWKRMVSEYMYLLSVEYKWGPNPHLKDQPACTVEGMNAFVEKNLANIQVGIDRYICDCHLLPQWDYIEGSDGHLWCSNVLPIEELTDRFNALMIEHGIELRLSPYEKANSASHYCPALSQDADLNLGGLFSASSKSLMRTVYAKDFAHLGDSFD